MVTEEDKPQEKDKKDRKYPRVPVKLELEKWAIPELKDHHIVSGNLSLSGIMLEIIPPLKDELESDFGGLLTISFLLSEEEGFLQVSSEIKWIKKSVINEDGKEVTRIGAQFIVVTPEIEESIKKFLESKMGD